MHPALVDSIRQRMREQTTEQLLELWTTNDRVTWSAEAFEAIKSILADRGHTDLPRQNDPAPVARPYVATGGPEAIYWMRWLRPVLWIGIVISSLTLFYQAVAVLDAWVRSSSYWLDGTWDQSVATLQYLVLPVLLITASVAGLRLVPWSRTALLTYAWVSLPAGVADFLLLVPGSNWHDISVLYEVAGHAVTSGHQLVLPIVLLVLLRRPEIASLFAPGRPGVGFDPAPAGEPPDTARNP